MKEKNIMIKTEEEIEQITSENIRIDVALMAHRKNISYVIDMLTKERKQIDKAILDSVNHKKVNTELFYTIISDFTEFNKEQFIAEYGEEEYNKFKTSPVHREQVRTK